ncbi:hypothetical protein [Methylobacterium aquaticum]|uniref:hypothetical protein n=1 Tax=Methylobacterium aquaticum TaxID=270351 RepID=UPI001932613B|nr:hypothetical protein [Methylobacterium aquaticum]QRE76513.1 hypothetical protein F1D61_25690 [Methylobacterium aquaticum]
MTPAQKQALEHLHRHGGEGAIDKHGALVASGVRLKFLADTWLRLMTTGHVEPCGPMRIKLTGLGRQAAEPEPVKCLRGGGFSDGHVPAHPGAE